MKPEKKNILDKEKIIRKEKAVGECDFLEPIIDFENLNFEQILEFLSSTDEHQISIGLQILNLIIINFDDLTFLIPFFVPLLTAFITIIHSTNNSVLFKQVIDVLLLLFKSDPRTKFQADFPSFFNYFCSLVSFEENQEFFFILISILCDNSCLIRLFLFESGLINSLISKPIHEIDPSLWGPYSKMIISYIFFLFFYQHLI